jgi:hypothetical protein
MKIGRALRALELSSRAPSRDPSGRPLCSDPSSGVFARPNDPKNCTCASAGFFFHIGGTHRSGTFLAVHRPYFENGKFGTLPLSEAKKAFEGLQESAQRYLVEIGVPQHIQDDVLGTASDQTLILDEKTVKTYFWGQLPYLHEWTKNKCARLSESERGRIETYSRRLLSARNAPDADISKAEWVDLDALDKKKDEERGARLPGHPLPARHDLLHRTTRDYTAGCCAPAAIGNAAKLTRPAMSSRRRIGHAHASSGSLFRPGMQGNC